MSRESTREKKPEDDRGSPRPAPDETSAPASADHRLLELQRRAGNSAVNALVQTKLEVGAADDAYEREAEDIASRVTGRAGGDSGSGHGGGGEGFTAAPDLADFVGRRGGGTQLAPAVRRRLEPTFGLDFGDVRVHTDNKTAKMAESIGARAFTHGN